MSFLSSLGLAVAGPIVGGLFSSHSAKKQAQQNADLSRENWQYQQSNAHQFEVQDLRNAGLNPILSATNSQMAGMSPVSGNDAGNFGNNISSALSGFLEREARKEMQAKDLEIENLKANIEQTRVGIEQTKAETEKFRAEAEAKLWNIQGNYYSSKQANETREADARIRHIASQIENENKLTNAEVDKLRSGIALDNATIDKLAADTKLSIERSNLTYWEKTQLITNLTDSSAKLKRMNARQQLEYLSTGVGEVQNKFGYGIRLMSPITGFGFGSNGYSSVRF